MNSADSAQASSPPKEKKTMLRKLWIPVLFLALSVFANAPAAELDTYLTEGRMAEGLDAYGSADNDADRFSLATLQIFSGVEQFSQGFRELGMLADSPLAFLPFLRLAAPTSGQPATGPATPEKTADLFRSLRKSFRSANRTLAKIEGGEFGVEINLSQVHLDFDGSGSIEPTEGFLASLGAVLGLPFGGEPEEDLVIRFDRADAVWLQGYTHFISAVLDIILAYDWRPVWNQCAHLLLRNPEPQPSFNRWAKRDENFDQWADIIAALHDMRLELTDDHAWPRASEEFQGMIATSRICWELVLAETDDELEWLPSPSQSGPRGSTITRKEIDAWMLVLNELEAITRGEKLVPHWRVRPGAGINLDKLIESPPELDLVLWIHGSALMPFMEEGPVSDDATWENLTAPFGPGFLQFAIWSN